MILNLFVKLDWSMTANYFCEL